MTSSRRLHPALELPAVEAASPSPPWRGIFGPTLALSGALSLGLFLQFNPLSATWGLPFLRLSDAILFSTIGLLSLYIRQAEVLRIARVSVLVFLPVSLAILLKFRAANGDTYFTLTFVASFACAMMLLVIGRREPRVFTWFSLGSLLGFAIAALVLFLQAAGLDFTAIGLGVPTEAGSLSALLAGVKHGGLWVHGNEAGHVFAIAGAPALYLAFRYRRPSIYAIYYAIFLATFAITLNRGGMIAPTLGLLVAYGGAGRAGAAANVFAALLVLVAIGVALQFLPALSGVKDSITGRFLMDGNASENVSERSETLVAGLAIVAKHPFGVGYVERVREMREASGIGTPHNGVVALGFQIGLAGAFAYILSIIRAFFRPDKHRSLPILLALFALPSMLFEELTLNPVFLFAVAVSIAATLGGGEAPRRGIKKSSDASPRGMRPRRDRRNRSGADVKA